jgi:hypothetical protein
LVRNTLARDQINLLLVEPKGSKHVHHWIFHVDVVVVVAVVVARYLELQKI